MTLAETFDLALQRHQAGRLAEAEALYRQILAVQPNHPGALHLLGVIAHQAGRHGLAVDWIRQAIDLAPNNPDAYSNLGEALRALGRFDDAVAAYQHALQLKPDLPEAHNNLGVTLKRLGRFAEALAAYRRAIELKPAYPEAHVNLGGELARQGLFDEAATTYRRAIELKPDYLEAHNNLGIALREQGQLDEAIAAYRRALAFHRDSAEVHNNLGNALRDRGQPEESAAECLQALRLKPNFPEAYNNLGNALRDQARLDEAIAAYRRAIELKPSFPKAHNNLGIALRDQCHLGEAAASCRRAIELQPDFAEAHSSLGNALRDQGELDAAVAAYRRALQLDPNFAEAHNNLGNALRERKHVAEAIAAYQRALELKPEFPEAHNNLGVALLVEGRLDEAVAACRRALELKSDFAEAHINLGAALRDRGQSDEAIAAYRRALQMKPEDVCAHSNLVHALHFHPDHDASTISGEQQRWNRQFSDPLKPFLQPHANAPDPARSLRIGYVSPDFRDHPVGRFLLPLFEGHDRERFELFCYSGTLRPDWLTERLRALATPARDASPSAGWRVTLGVSDSRLADMIRADGVDILVDLAQHTGGNRLPVFARQPAPVQVSWLGYPGSTGLPGIGFRLTDARMDPPGELPPGSTDEPVRLPDCWCCYDPAGESPEINALPALSANAVTFGSLNNFTKVNEYVLTRWARILEAVKRSRLLMFCPEGSARERVRAFFGSRGIATNRVEFAGLASRWNYLLLYHRIDIALDPFPYNGMTTTCDALWMGVPVLTLPKEMPASRAGLSLLSTIGLGELVASSEENYVQIAVDLAGNLPRLAHLRATLRPRMQSSPLMDAPRFTRNVESAYRSIWQRWCAISTISKHKI